MHGRSHNGIVLFGIISLNLQALMNVKHLMLGWVTRVLANPCTSCGNWCEGCLCASLWSMRVDEDKSHFVAHCIYVLFENLFSPVVY